MNMQDYDQITREFMAAVKERSKKFGRGEVSYASCVGFLEALLFELVVKNPEIALYLQKETKKLVAEQK